MLERLRKHFPRQPEPTLRDISLAVQQGKVLALLGPSGSGKSTILKLIAGIEQPDSGDIRLNGQSILGVPANQRGAVLMFQKAYLFPFMNVADNIGFGLKVQGAPRKTIREQVARMLELVELPGVQRKYPHQMSGGEQQRIALARALVTNPKVLLLDEPLSSLDTAVRHTLQESIRRIQREMGITTILVTHDLGEAIAMSDHIALLLDGAIEAYDAPRNLFQRPPTRQAARFVGISTFLDGRIEGKRFVLEHGVLALPGNAERQPGQRQATFAIRPEHIRLLEEPVHNTLPGVVADVFYRGEFTEYQVALGGAHSEQIIRVRAYQLPRSYARGEALHVQFPPERLFEVGPPGSSPDQHQSPRDARQAPAPVESVS
jgi:ABC-type Fe3+/spermidine/putrescine transport system ATPase subunit